MGLALYNNKQFNEAIENYSKAIELFQLSPLYYCNRGRTFNAIEQTQKALDDFNRALELSQNINQIQSINDNNRSYIKKVLETDRKDVIEQLSKLQKVDIETETAVKQLNINNLLTRKVLTQHQALKEAKNFIINKIIDLFDNINIKPIIDAKEITKHEILAILQQNPNTVLEVLAKYPEAYQYPEIMPFLITCRLELKQTVTEMAAKQQIQEKALLYSGVYEKAQIIEGFKKLEERNIELYSYCKTLYWSSINLFYAYRNLSTGLIKPDLEKNRSNSEDWLVKGAKAVASFGAEIAKGVPFVGGVIGAVDSVINDIYSAVQQNNIDNKVNAITQVIQLKLGMEDDISINVAKMALNMTISKEEMIVNPQKMSPGKTQSCFDWLKHKLEDIKQKVLPTVYLYNKDSYGVELALQDVTLLMVFLAKNYQEIIKNKETLDIQCTNIIKYGGLKSLLKEAKSIDEKMNKSSSETQKGISKVYPDETEPLYGGKQRKLDVDDENKSCCKKIFGKCLIFPAFIHYDNPLLNKPKEFSILAQAFGMLNVLNMSDVLLKKEYIL